MPRHGHLCQIAALGGDVPQDCKARSRDRGANGPALCHLFEVGNTHEAMRYYTRESRLLPLGTRQKLRRELAYDIAIKRRLVSYPEPVENRE